MAAPGLWISCVRELSGESNIGDSEGFFHPGGAIRRDTVDWVRSEIPFVLQEIE
jgi:hypothetical protein